LISAPKNHEDGREVGEADLFDLDGQLLATFRNPGSRDGDQFGVSLSAVGTDRVVIGSFLDDRGGSSSGRAYLFDSRGTLLTTFAKPFPVSGDEFGVSVAGIGNDLVLIGAFLDDTGASDAGAAYLFNTSGALLTVFTNPVPASDDLFGIRVAVVGPDRVLISAMFDDPGAEDAGSAYLYSLDGQLQSTLKLPNPVPKNRFGVSMVTMGRRLVIGALGGEEAYLFGVPGLGPKLNIAIEDGDLLVRWVTDETGWALQETASLKPPVTWVNSLGPVTRRGVTNEVLQSLGSGRFFRLYRP
jgi:hypothetical protein